MEHAILNFPIFLHVLEVTNVYNYEPILMTFLKIIFQAGVRGEEKLIVVKQPGGADECLGSQTMWK